MIRNDCGNTSVVQYKSRVYWLPTRKEVYTIQGRDMPDGSVSDRTLPFEEVSSIYLGDIVPLGSSSLRRLLPSMQSLSYDSQIAMVPLLMRMVTHFMILMNINS